ncbi:unnamed protein product [Cyclocybe aegerita]|uniref:Uncharacterized protein n=1 Tax=Cyclocybe aegerita TaxID=1973307 RepID=A0A8S0WYC8_CYCAE|nr:unnamed protein product [Cyclocybe aegerita]
MTGFTQWGLRSHLQQSLNPLCQDYHSEHEQGAAGVSSASEDEYVGPGTRQHSHSSPPVLAFQGDAFGSADDYLNDDLGQDVEMSVVDLDAGARGFDGPTGSAGDSDSEHLDELIKAEMVAELEAGWEPQREGAPVDHPDDVDMVEQDGGEEDVCMPIDPEDMGVNLDAPCWVVEKLLIDEGHGVKPKVVVRYSEKYPSSKAGAAMKEPNKHQAVDTFYQAAIAGSDTNLYAPFASRID